MKLLTEEMQTVRKAAAERPPVRKLALSILLLLVCLTAVVAAGLFKGSRTEVDLLPFSEWSIGQHEFNVSSDNTNPAVLFTVYCFGPVSFTVRHE
jgi:hypothetical protein